ncbi:MAG: asparagine synthase-related protein [Patescibacteria group bacterium]|nr:asparagine synthase-related protein [Patescibacteria group bacterium]
MTEKQLIQKYQQILNNLFLNYQKNINNKKIGVLLSGGIDSSIIAYFTNEYFKNPTFFTLHSKNALDLEYVKILNKKLKQKLIIVEFDENKILKIKNKIIEIIKKNNLPQEPTHISIAGGFYLLLKKAKKENIDYIFTGQGPDILLAGYHMYEKISLENLNKKIVDDISLLEIDKKRDGAIADFFQIKLINPYLEKEFIDFSLKIPPYFKINKINNEIYEKYISRKLAEKLNLPKEIIFRHKKAFQYSTKIRKYV